MTAGQVGACIVGCWFLLAACRTDPGSDMIAQERASVVAWTLPPGAAMTTGITLARKGSGLEASWEVSAPMTWAEYRGWSRSHGLPGYREVQADDAHISFVRTLPGDAFLVEVAVTGRGPPLRLRAMFSAYPD